MTSLLKKMGVALGGTKQEIINNDAVAQKCLVGILELGVAAHRVMNFQTDYPLAYDIIFYSLMLDGAVMTYQFIKDIWTLEEVIPQGIIGTAREVYQHYKNG